jgi:ABC-type transport system involved in multi-copper enzyme maturation permease subunit
VAVGFAVYTLVLGTILALAGCIVFVAEEQWLLVALMLLIEAVFIFAFTRLVAQARTRSPRTRSSRRRSPGKPA